MEKEINMSADNGIYILKTKDQYRVTHAQAIENIYYEYDNICASDINYRTNKLIPTRVVEYWGSCKYTHNPETAYKIAESMLKRISFVEYGIRTFIYNKTWKHIIEDAKKKAEIEIEFLKKNGGSDCEISSLQKILDMDYKQIC